MHLFFPADTKGKNSGRAVGRKKQNQTKSPTLSVCVGVTPFLKGTFLNVMACSQLNPLIFILYYLI